MRIINEVSDLFNDKEFIHRVNMLSGVRGGWERWFQMELAYHIAVRYKVAYDVTLEDSGVYPGTNMRADLVLRGRSYTDTVTVVELKCQTASETLQHFCDQIEGDIANVTDLAPGMDYQVIALVRSQNDVAPLYQALATKYPSMVQSRLISTVISPGGVINVYIPAQL